MFSSTNVILRAVSCFIRGRFHSVGSQCRVIAACTCDVVDVMWQTFSTMIDSCFCLHFARERTTNSRFTTDVRCCYGNIHRCRCRCGLLACQPCLDHLAKWPTIMTSYQLITISVIAISCYDVTSSYIPFTFTAKESWEIMLSPHADRLPPMARVRTILVLGTGQYSQILGSIAIGGYFLLFWHPIQYQSDSSQNRPPASEWLFSSTFDLYSDTRTRLSGHHADKLLFIKHNHCHHQFIIEFWGFFVVIAMLYTSIGIGIGYWYR